MKRAATSALCTAFLAMALLAGCATSDDAKTADGKAPDMKAGDAKAVVATAPASRPAHVRLMTYNLRFAAARGKNSWPERRPVSAAMVRDVDPDLFGVQEGLYEQLKDMQKDNPQYEWIGTGRDGGSHGEFMAIFYKKDRFDPKEYMHFWLSDTPEVIGSTTWGNSNRRMVTWVRFLDKQTGKQFYYWNTHLDHQVQTAREKASALIMQRMEALKSNGLPIILGGDFNATAHENKAYDIITGDGFLKDAYTAPEEGTFHNFTGTADKQGRIDWIFIHGPIEASNTHVVKFKVGAQYPSDHFTVVTDLTF